jgi:hypothetical protein
MRKTTEARVFTMACDLLLGQSEKVLPPNSESRSENT